MFLSSRTAPLKVTTEALGLQSLYLCPLPLAKRRHLCLGADGAASLGFGHLPSSEDQLARSPVVPPQRRRPELQVTSRRCCGRRQAVLKGGSSPAPLPLSRFHLHIRAHVTCYSAFQWHEKSFLGGRLCATGVSQRVVFTGRWARAPLSLCVEHEKQGADSPEISGSSWLVRPVPV